jgi:class 3 adenylate cyclase
MDALVRMAGAELAGDLERAVSLMPGADRAGGAPWSIALLRGSRARVFFHAGNEEAARQELAAWADAAQPTPFGPGSQAAVHECLVALGDDNLARETYEDLLRPASKIMRLEPFSGRNLDPLRGALALRLGLVDEAEQHYRTGLEWTERERCPIESGRCLQGLAELADRRGERREATRYLDRAAKLFQEHGAKLYLDQVIAKKLELQGIDPAAPQTSIDAVAAVVQSEQPDLPPKAVAPDGTVTILFTDIEGSTAMTERLGDQRWLDVLRGHNAIVRKRVAAHEGFEVKAEGDGFMLAFQSARKALECAVDIQRAFADRNESADEPIQVRIGLHTGEAIKEADDFFGKNVILAARIAGQAQGGEILVSSLLKELTESAGDIAFGEGREVELKGLAGTHRVFEVGWEKPTSRSAH